MEENLGGLRIDKEKKQGPVVQSRFWIVLSVILLLTVILMGVYVYRLSRSQPAGRAVDKAIVHDEPAPR